MQMQSEFNHTDLIDAQLSGGSSLCRFAIASYR